MLALVMRAKCVKFFRSNAEENYNSKKSDESQGQVGRIFHRYSPEEIRLVRIQSTSLQSRQMQITVSLLCSASV